MRWRCHFFLAASLSLAPCAFAQDKDKDKDAAPTIAEKTKGLTERPGLIASYLDTKKAKVYLKLPPANSSGLVGEYLFVETMATGLGSNDLGIDRGQTGRTDILDIKTVGNKVIFVVPNLSYRATSSNPEEIRAVTDAFATSIIFATTAVAADADGSLLIDVTDFAVRDAHNSGDTLKGYSLDKERSVLDVSQTKAFPENLEFQSFLTFTTSGPGALVGNHAPDAKAVTLTERQSIVKLPEPGYKPRKFDPRTGAFNISFLDFSAPLGQPLLTMYAARHRLEKTEPYAARSAVKKPIVYYVDRGVPEPIRSALIQGGNYWAKAFDEAGFVDAYRVELMPEGIDPLDTRYNVVMWLNRSTRGWAYGQSITDPRTGEIIRGAVNLDSQRIRQDIMLYEALLGTAKTASGSADDPVQIALSRTRQLAAHEIGHTLGFQHNFAASTYGRASVMDYPAPLINIGLNDTLDFSDAYMQGIGAWDMQAVKWNYSQFTPNQDEAAELDKIVRDGIYRKLLFLSDDDATETNGANPLANRWDNGKDPIKNLETSLRIREIAMKKFGERNIKTGQPIGLLEEVFGPLYFFHRYDIDSVAKMVGGVHYVHAVKGDGQPAQYPVAPERQVAAFDALLTCLRPENLDVPQSIANLIGPRPNSYPDSRELFQKDAPYIFDTVAAASSLADLVLSRMTDPGRCARIIEENDRNPDIWPLNKTFAMLSISLASQPTHSLIQGDIALAVQHVWVTRLMDVAANPSASPKVANAASAQLRRMLKSPGYSEELVAEIRRFLSRPLTDARRVAPPLPALPGSPIGG